MTASKTPPKEYKQDSFHRGIINTYEWDSMDYQSGQYKGLQALSYAQNVVIQKDEGGMMYKRRPFKFIGSADAQYSRLIPFEVQQGSSNIGQVFCFTGNQATQVINYNNNTFSVVQNITNTPYTQQQLQDIDYEFCNQTLILAHPNVPPQVSYYNISNPSLTPLVYNSNNAVNTTPSYFGLFRGFEQIDPNLRIQVNANNPSGTVQLLNNLLYKFKVGDILRMYYIVSPGAIQNLSVYPYMMDFKILTISNGGDTATYQVINGTDDFNALILAGQIPSPPSGVPSTPSSTSVVCIPGLNHDNTFFANAGITEFPAAVTFSHDQRLIFMLADNIYGSQVGAFLNFYKTKLNTLELPFAFTIFQKVISPGSKICCLNDKLFVLSGSELIQYDYTNSTASFLSPTATRDVSFTNIKPKKIDIYMVSVSSCARTLQFSFFIQNVDIIRSEPMLAYENDILDGNILDVVVQKNPVVRIWILLDSGTIVVMNVKAGTDFNAVPYGITKFNHPNGKFISITSVNCAQQTPGNVIVGVLDNVTNKISYEAYDEAIQFTDNTNDVFLDRMVRFLDVNVSSINFVNEEYTLNLYGSTNLDGNAVTAIIASADNSIQARYDDLLVSNGSIQLSRDSFAQFTGTINIYVGTQYQSLFSPVPFDIYRQGESDYSHKASKNITASYLTVHKTTKMAINNNNNYGCTIKVGQYDSSGKITIKEGYKNLTPRTVFQNINLLNADQEKLNRHVLFINDDANFFSIRGLGFDTIINSYHA